MSRDRFRLALGPTYLFLCLILGGSVQGVWSAALLQLLGIAIIAASFLKPSESPLAKPEKQLGLLLGAAILLIVLQIIPLPPALWTALPGRRLVAEGRALLGLSPGWSSISLAPYDTLATMLPLLPPVAMLCAMFRLKAYSSSGIAAAVLAAMICGVGLGVLQTGSADALNSPWYPYPVSNFGFATGFFANSNHMASLLLVAIPFTVALAAKAREASKDKRKQQPIFLLGAAGLGVVLVGIALNGSLTGYGLVIPVTIFSLLMVIPLRPGMKKAAVVLSIAGLAAFVMVLLSPLSDRMAASGAATSVSTRQTMIIGSIAAVKEFAPFGSGLGTFEKIYRLSEDPDRIEPTFVNHAHNDYLEMAVETGLPGVVLILLFLLWWGAAVRRMMASPAADGFAKAGAIGSATVLIHSLVDYPLRTSAMAALFAACLGLLLLSRRSAASETDIRPTRHLTIG